MEPTTARAQRACTISKGFAKEKANFSCDDAKPFHFFVKPDAVNNQRNCGRERRDRASKIKRCSCYKIDPQAPGTGADRKQRCENDENNMVSLKGHLPEDGVVVPCQYREPEETEHKKPGENQNAIDEPFFRSQMHEYRGHEPGFECRYEHSDRYVGFVPLSTRQICVEN